ncbi:unnamed protein product [Ixodes pacificus]
MSTAEDDLSNSTLREQRLAAHSAEDNIVSKVNELSTALLDTSFNIHSLNSKIQAYHHEQNAAVEMLKENLDVCLKHITTGKSRAGSVEFSNPHESPTNPWRMVRDKETSIIELETKNQHLKAKLDVIQQRLKEKSDELSERLAECSKRLAEREREATEYEEKLRVAEKKLMEQQRLALRASSQLRDVEEDCEKQTTRARSELERLEQTLLSERSRSNSSQQALQAELKQLHLESSSWQERYVREKQKASQLSEELVQLKAELQRYRNLDIQDVDGGNNLSTKNALKEAERRLAQVKYKYDCLRKEMAELKTRSQAEVPQDLSRTAQSEDYERLKLEKRDIEEVCLSFDRKFQKQAQLLKRMEERLKESQARIVELTQAKSEKQKSYQDFVKYISDRVDLLVGLLSMRSSDTFQALFAAELVERRPVSFQVAEVKSKFHWMTQEVRSLCLGDLEMRARSSESSLAPAKGKCVFWLVRLTRGVKSLERRQDESRCVWDQDGPRPRPVMSNFASCRFFFIFVFLIFVS